MKLLDVELSLPVPPVTRPTVGRQWVLVRLHGDPLGLLRLEDRAYEPGELADLAVGELGPELATHLVRDALESGSLHNLASDFRAFPPRCSRQAVREWPPLTAAVCTRNRTDFLRSCLEALLALDYPAERLEILVVDNAPADQSTERLVRQLSTRLRYVCEPRPGLNWARNRAALEAGGAIIAYTDDDVLVERGWARAIAGSFGREPAAMALTGLVVPDAIDTDAQLLFENYGGFGRGVRRQYAQVDLEGRESAVATHCGTGKYGTGANMAFRRRVLETTGLFDPALDVGTVTHGGGDLEMFFRVIKAGHLLVYEPSAIVHHRHRRDHEALGTQFTNNGIGYFAYLARSFHAYPDERAELIRQGVWWFWFWNVRRLIGSVVHPRRFPRGLILGELLGSIRGIRRYRKSVKDAAAVARRFGPQEPLRPQGVSS
jgi:glycosyltransferase involved in cell wall biosynthesis